MHSRTYATIEKSVVGSQAILFRDFGNIGLLLFEVEI